MQETKTFRMGLLLAGALALSACSDPADTSVDSATEVAPAEAAPADDNALATSELPARQVLSESLPYGEVGTDLVYGHFAFPADMVEPLPAVVMIHERWGLDETMTNKADRLASHGYIVLAVDLLNGRTTLDPVAGNKLMADVLESPDETLENIRQALDFVRSAAGAPAVAVFGSDLGGEWALKSSYLLPGMVDAVVTAYGQVTSDTDQLSGLEVPVLGLFGGADLNVRIDAVRSFETALVDLDKEHTIHVYDEAGHYFLNPKVENRYRAGAAHDAWRRTLTFLAEHLDKPGS